MFRGIIISIVLNLLAFGSADAATIYVPDDYPTIQDAINAAANGDTVIVRPGTFKENIDFVGKEITLKSEMGAAVTNIDGNKTGSVVTCQTGETDLSVLDGFTINNGYGVGGGGMYNGNSSPTVTNCIFRNNSGTCGGGMFNNNYGNPTVTNCTFKDNYTDNSGGGMCNWYSSPTVTNCTFTRNFGGTGGGMWNGNSNPMVSNCLFLSNSTFYGGGGVYNYNSEEAVTDKCTFSYNTAARNGGGMVNWENSSSLVINCTFTGNTATDGGGMFNHYNSNPTVTNCAFTGNSATQGGGMRNSNSSPTVTNCTFTGNSATQGGGMFFINSNPTVTNTILWNNDATEGPEIWIGDSIKPSTLTISYSDVDGSQSSCYVDPGCTLNWGAGMIDADPLFADSSNDDYHLTWDSPCKDTGDNTAVTEPCDFEGDPRIADSTVDMGADEFHTHLYHIGSVTPGGKIQVKVVGNPGMTPVTLALGSGIQDPPQPTPYGDLYLVLPPLQKFNLGSIPSTGVLVKPAVVPSNWQAGDEYPFQALLGPLAPGSVLSNLMTLMVE